VKRKIVAKNRVFEAVAGTNLLVATLVPDTEIVRAEVSFLGQRRCSARGFPKANAPFGSCSGNRREQVTGGLR
jgi:hypothetical protein